MTISSARTAALLAVAGLAAGCTVRDSRAQGAPPAAAAALAVTTVEVKTAAIPRTLTLTGTLLAEREAAVAADVVGKVAATFVERGTAVRKGAPLVSIDRRSAALAEAEARSQAAAARTQRVLSDSECARADRLFGEGAINEAEHDRARAACQAATHAAAAADARARLAGKTLTDLVVRAPFDGVVAERLVTAGEYVRPDSRVATVVDMDRLRLELSVPEQALPALAPGSEVQFRVAAYPDQVFQGRVRHVGAAVRRATRDLLVEAMVDNRNGRLRPGMFAIGGVTTGATDLPVVPASAVRTESAAGAERLFVVVGGRAEERIVRTAQRQGDSVAVVAGVHAGDRVVVAPPAGLRDGQAVK